MRTLWFFVISILLLSLAFFYQPLYATFPELFEPVYIFINDIGTDILFIAGFLSLMIALFSGLPTWASILLFILLMSGCGYYLIGKDVQIKIDNIAIL